MTQNPYRTPAAKVDALMARHGLGRIEAAQTVRRDELRGEILNAEDWTDLRAVLLKMCPPMRHSDDY
ncbi:MAG: hypothetical protein INH13_25845 [Cupriavidus sp.]|nr:hypothetical protein [Cupriavidus sp.]